MKRHTAVFLACWAATAWCGPVAEAEPALPEALEGTGGLFTDFLDFTAESPPVVALISTQDPDEIRRQVKRADGPRKILHLKERLEELSGLPCLLVHYTQLTRGALDKPNVKAIVLTAAKKMKDPDQADELAALVRETQVPLIGFCGAHHFIYMAYGGIGEAMRELRPDEKDPSPKFMPGQYKEWGFMKGRIVRRDPLFDGLGPQIVVSQRHYAECKTLPEVFDVLASSDECRVQAIKHKTRLLYGTQFYPDGYDDEHPDGKVILRNFFRIAGVIK